MRVNAHQARVWNVTRNRTEFVGSSEYASYAYVQSRSVFECDLKIVGPDAEEIEIQHRCQVTRSLNGYGAKGGFGPEVYTIVAVWKMA